MSDATVLPTASQLRFFYYADKPKLDVGLTASADDDTVYVTTAPRDRDGAIITGSFLIGVTNKAGKTERIWVPARATDGSGNVTAGVSTDGLSFLGCIRGIDPNGLDYTVGDTDFILALDGGSRITCVIAAQSGELLRAAIQGLIATGGAGLILGTDADGTVTIYRSTGVGTYVGWIRWNTSNDKAEYSNDGSSWNTFDNVTASNLVVVTNSDTTPGNFFDKSASGTGIVRTVLNPGGNEQLEFSANGTLANIISDVTATAAEINQALDGIAAGVTAAAMNIVFGGSTSNADAYHTHTGLKLAATAIEAINGSSTAQPFSVLGNNFKKLLLINASGVTIFSNLTGTARAIGNADATTRLAQSFSITDALATTITLESMTMLLELVGAPADNIYVEIQTDSGGSGPTGTVVTNGTSAVIAGGSLSTTMVPAKFTWATPPALTSGTKYWFVIRRSGVNDGANYYRGRDTSASTYASQEYMTYTASSGAWASGAGLDIQLLAQFNLDYDGKVAISDADNLTRAHFKGFTKSNVSAGQSIAGVISGFSDGFSSISQGAPYWLDTNQGQIVASIPSLTTTLTALVPRIKVGEGAASDTVEVNPTFESLLEIATAYSSGQPLVETGAAAASMDIFIETGFPPREFDIRYIVNNVAGTATDDRYYMSKYIGTTQMVGFRIISPSLTLNGATSTIDATAMTYVSIQAIYENGYLLRITSANAGEDLGSISVLAKA